MQTEIAECFEEWEWESDEFDNALHTFSSAAQSAVEVEVRRALTYAFAEYFKQLRVLFTPTENDVIIEVDTWCEEFDGYETLFNRRVSLLEQLHQQDRFSESDFLQEAVSTMRRIADMLEEEMSAESNTE